MSYFQRLSVKQRFWLVGTLVAAVSLVVLGWLLEPKSDEAAAEKFTTRMTIRQVASKTEATGFAVAKELGLKRNVDKDTPLEELGVEAGKLHEVTAHLMSHRPTALKYYIFAAISLFGLVWLLRLGRPDGSPQSERKTWYPREVYIATLFLAVAFCGFALGKSPNPMEGAVKLFKGMVGLQPSIPAVVLAFVFFIGLAVVGNKIVCGWACPFGALQELIYSLPILRKIKRRKIPFRISNTIRAGLFIVMLLLLFGLVGGKKGFVLYHSINPFNLFDLHFETVSILLTVILFLILAVFMYRPFCQFICPFGLISWLAERFSLTRVRIDRNRCTQCGACARACPLEAARHKVEGKTFGADCYSCARCLTVCPEEAIAYRGIFPLGEKGEEELPLPGPDVPEN